jgi:hypothetical protein
LNLNNTYRIFVYERPLPQGRGLPAIDDDGVPIPIPEAVYTYDSSDEDCERVVQEIFANVTGNATVNAVRKRYFTM